ncbi:MAG: hypothetical protein P8M22_02620 [Phycisphaerales bacterium]|nr:hypothetical protein [Phycisphaerales bacterium]
MSENPEIVALKPAFSVDYGRARDLLDGASLLVGAHDSGGPVAGLGLAGYVMDGSINLRSLYVSAAREDEARSLLDHHGVILAGGDTVIDISELNCPSCGAVLPRERNAGQDGHCDGCDMQFTWIDVTAEG